MTNPKGKAPGASYRDDGYYRPIESALERKHGLPDGTLARIRKNGERSDRNAVSSAGARSVYQIIPGTRDRFERAYGINAYAGDREAAEVAALHLRDDLRKTGSMETAVRRYIGGPDPKQHGKVTEAYVGRVTGKLPTSMQRVDGVVAMKPGTAVQDISFEDVMNIRPADLAGGKRLPKKKVTASDVAPKVTGARIIANATQGTAPIASTGQDASVDRAASEASRVTEAQRVEALPSFFDRVSAAVDENWISNAVIRGLDGEVDEGDPEWQRKFADRLPDIAKMASDEDELEMLLSPDAQRSEASFNAINDRRIQRQNNISVINSTPNGWAYTLGASVLDPVGWVATYGIGKAFQLGRAGFGIAKAGLAGALAEGAVTNVTFTGAMEYGGESKTFGDYVSAGAIGAGMMGAFHGIGALAGKADNSSEAIVNQGIRDAQDLAEATRTEVTAKLGPDANDAAIEQGMQEVFASRIEKAHAIGVGARSDADRFWPESDAALKTSDKSIATAAIERNGMANWPDAAEARTGAEMAIRADEIVAVMRSTGDMDRGLQGKFLKAFGQESDALTMIRSGSPMLQAMAVQLLESTTGAGGRKASAALSKALLNRGYSSQLIGYESAFQIWRKSEGIGAVTAATSADVRKKFDDLVAYEIRARSDTVASVTTNNAIKKAADDIEEGFNRMRLDQQRAKVLGNERFGNSSKGYFPQRINAQKLFDLTPKQTDGVVNVLARQFRELNEYSYVDKATKETVKKNFDAKFSKALARRYIDEARGRAKGSAFVPANLQTGESAGILEDALKAMSGLGADDRAAILGKFSRGGASYTKGRLKMDLAEEIGDGMRLGDLFNNDIMSVYRSYAQRVSGEVALAQYGIYGRQGLNVARRVAEAQGATVDELKALERIGAEFLNEPWGQVGAGYTKTFAAMRNLRSVTAAAVLGGMAYTQLGESGNAIAVVGVGAVLSTMVRSPRYRKEILQMLDGKSSTNPILKDFDDVYGAIGGDGYSMSRLFDAPEGGIELYDQASIGAFTKAVRAGSHFTAVASGFRALHSVQVRGMSEQIVKKAIRYIKQGKEDAALNDMGITKEIRDDLAKHMDQLATFDSKGRLTGLNLLDAEGLNPRTIRDLAQVVERGAGQIIQKTYIGETGPWAHNEFLKLLFQFRTFGITSIEKQYGRNVAKFGGGLAGNAKTFAIMVGSMGFALPIHMARVHAGTIGMSDAARDKYIEERTTSYALGKALMNYTSVTGLAPDMLDVTTTFGIETGLAPEYLKDQVGARGQQVGAASLVPSLGTVDKLYKGTVGGRFEKLPKLLPGANTPGLVPFFNAVAELGAEDE